jgi:hypothetical protein
MRCSLPCSRRRKPTPLLPILLPGFERRNPRKENLMRGYVVRKGDRWYAVVYEGLDPVTG